MSLFIVGGIFISKLSVSFRYLIIESDTLSTCWTYCQNFKMQFFVWFSSTCSSTLSMLSSSTSRSLSFIFSSLSKTNCMHSFTLSLSVISWVVITLSSIYTKSSNVTLSIFREKGSNSAIRVSSSESLSISRTPCDINPVFVKHTLICMFVLLCHTPWTIN